MEKNREISVIVPVYNVKDYIDECLDSILKQTFSDFEVLLIDDGSTDGSDLKCDEWATRDCRFKVYHKNNEGLSLTRNYGIQRASGKYISCIDSDDWVDIHFLEYLYKAAENDQAEIAECDVYRIDNRSGKKTKRNCYGYMGIYYTKTERIIYGYTETWRCLYRRDFWEKYQIEYPDCHSQARGIYALLVALANKVVCVREPLYYYRKFRAGSLSAKARENGVDENAEGIAAYKALIAGFCRCGIFEEYEAVLRPMLYYKSSDSLAGMFTRKKIDDYIACRNAYGRFIAETFPKSKEIRYAVLGGYNLNRIVWSMNLLHDPYLRFNFSSIISIANPVEIESIEHKNKYRELMINRDVNSDFWRILKEEKVTFLVIDFIEERFDIIKMLTGYITKSDAFDGASHVQNEWSVIQRDSDECFNLWKLSFKEFIWRIDDIIPITNIIIVENYLSEEVGTLDIRVKYDNVAYIRKTNGLLKKYYDFVRKEYPKIPMIEAYKNDNYFTDHEYEYGAIPSHLNDIVNWKIAIDIFEKFNV